MPLPLAAFFAKPFVASVVAGGKSVFGWLVGPTGRWVLLGAVVLGIWWWERDAHADKAVAVVEERHARQLADAAAEVRRLTGVRDTLARAVSERARQDALEAQNQAKAATATGVKVVTRFRDRFIPADCPTTLPPEVEDEGRKAVERANRRAK